MLLYFLFGATHQKTNSVGYWYMGEMGKGLLLFSQIFLHTLQNSTAKVCQKRISVRYSSDTYRKFFWGNQTHFFGYGVVTIEMFEKKMFQIMCHMMGCND